MNQTFEIHKKEGSYYLQSNYLWEFNLVKHFNVTLLNVVEMTRVTGYIFMVKGREIWYPYCYKSYQWGNQKNKGCLTHRAFLYIHKRIPNEKSVGVINVSEVWLPKS